MIFGDSVFSLRSLGIIFLGAGKAFCFCRDKNSVLVFNREGPGLAGIGQRFPNEGRGGHDGCALQPEGPVQARIISGHVQRRAERRVQVKHPGIRDAMWER